MRFGLLHFPTNTQRRENANCIDLKNISYWKGKTDSSWGVCVKNVLIIKKEIWPILGLDDQPDHLVNW